MLKLLVVLSALALAGCQTARSKSLALVKDRFTKLKPLERWSPTGCTIDAHLTQPSFDRYVKMYPKEKLKNEPWAFAWKSRETSCELHAKDRGEAAKTQEGLMKNAMCLLMQVHWVNSPFDELEVKEEDIQVTEDKTVHIRQGSGELGIYLPRDAFTVETRTRGHGVFTAVYEQAEGEWLPASVEQRKGDSIMRLDGIEYDQQRVNNRRMIRSMWMSVGTTAPGRQAQLVFSGCY